VLPIQIEVRGEQELHQALAAGAERCCLDNMTPAEANSASAGTRMLRLRGWIRRITLENVRAYAETGRISLFRTLTHSRRQQTICL